MVKAKGRFKEWTSVTEVVVLKEKEDIHSLLPSHPCPPFFPIPFSALCTLLPSPQPYQGIFTQDWKHTGREQPLTCHRWDVSADMLAWDFQSLELWEKPFPSVKPASHSVIFGSAPQADGYKVFPPQSYTTLGRRSCDEMDIKYSQPISFKFSTSVACFEPPTFCQVLV